MSTVSHLIHPRIPTEILIKIVEHIPFDEEDVRDVALAHPRLHSIVTTFQRSISKNMAARSLPHATVDFPSNPTWTYKWLASCVGRYDVIDEMMAFLKNSSNFDPVAEFNTGLVHAGMLLVYRLHDFGKDTAKQVDFVNSLPRDPMIALFLAIQYSVQAAQQFGTGAVKLVTDKKIPRAERAEINFEIESCFAEGVMTLGPKYALETIQCKPATEQTLRCLIHEHAYHAQSWHPKTLDPKKKMPEFKLGDMRDPADMPISLWATLRKRMAAFFDCELMDVLDRTLDEVDYPYHSLAKMGVEAKESILRGENVPEEEK